MFTTFSKLSSKSTYEFVCMSISRIKKCRKKTKKKYTGYITLNFEYIWGSIVAKTLTRKK